VSVTFVKKVLASGEPCPKCRDVEERLSAGGHWGAIDRTIVADERDADSEGMRLAARHGITRAPFFVVELEGKTTVYTVYLKFLKEHLQAARPVEAAEAVLRSHPELDLL
jgi:hypothetical protein